MFDEILGLPAHPLIVHAPLVLVPLLIVVAIGHVALPELRGRVEWLLAALAAAAPVAAAAACESGEALRRRLAARGLLAPELAESIAAHATLGRALLGSSLALGAVAIALILIPRALAPHARREVRTAVTVGLVLVLCGLASATGWYVVATGHTGARMIWSGR